MQNAEKISITMTPEMVRALKASVEAGDYASTSEALRDAVRVWRREREERAQRIESIRARVQRSVDDPRPNLTGAEVRQRLAALHDETVKSAPDEAR